MFHRSLLRLTIFVAGFGLVLGSLAASGQDDSNKRGRKYKAPPPTARIEVTILRASSGKPIENAAVVFHPMAGEKDQGNMELKTNEDGKTVIDVLPIGDTVRLQVIAHGFQTFGQDYKIDKDEMAIEIKLNRPGEQYSIYKPHSKTVQDGQSTVTDGSDGSSTDGSGDKPADQSKDSAAGSDKKDTKDQPSGSSAQPNAQSNSGESQQK